MTTNHSPFTLEMNLSFGTVGKLAQGPKPWDAGNQDYVDDYWKRRSRIKLSCSRLSTFDSELSSNAAELVYGAALTATGDTVIEQSTTIYDLGSRPVASLSYKQREDNPAFTGLLTPNPSNSYRNAAITWYDRANRVTHATTFGRDDGTTRYVFSTGNTIIDSDADGIPNEAEGSARVVNGSNDWITSEVQYDVAGRAYRSVDNLGRIGQTQFDALNRPTATIQNFIDGTSTPSELATDQLTAYVYDSAGRPVEIHNWNATGTTLQHQYTRNLYESLVDASWTTSVIYPDSSDTTSAGTDQVKYFYDALGRMTQMIDQRGVDHRYDYDSKGRFFKDRIVNAIAGVDATIKRIELTFDDMSRVKKVTSYDLGSAGNVVNEVEYAYSGYGLILQTKQAHNGVTGPTTPAINYIYNDGAVGGEAKFVRLTSMVYPAGEDTHYIYPTSGIGNALNRVDSIAVQAAGTTKFSQYKYLGVDTIVTISHPAITGGLKLTYGAAGTYAGWDRFGRIVNQQWTNEAGTTTRDRTQYTYDRNSNRLTRTNSQQATLSEVYTFDGLDRLTSLTRTGLNKTWVLDSTGNWNSLAITTTGTVTETRTHNAANEVLTVSAQTAPIHDAAGNITQAAKPNTPASNQVYVYDGWNRLTQVKETNGTVIATYEYDGRGNRIQKTTGATVRDYFHNDGGQVVEVRVNSVLNQTFVWDLSYIDTPVMTRRDTGSDGTLDQSYYFTFDALRNVTSLINASNGNVLERYHYDAYGKVQVYNSTWTPLSASAYGNITTFTGRELDSESGLYYFRARYFDPSLGRFLARDPLGYVDGMNLYEGYFVPGGVDPWGLRAIMYDEDTGISSLVTPPRRNYRTDQAKESVFWTSAAVFWDMTGVKIGKGIVAVFTGDAGRGIGDRAVVIFENNSGEEFVGTKEQWKKVGIIILGETAGTNEIAQAGVGFDMVEERYLEGDERIARGAGGVGTFSGWAAGGAYGATRVFGKPVAVLSTEASIVPKGGKPGSYVPNRTLPTDKQGVPMPDSEFPHTQIGRSKPKYGSEPQAREWDYGSNGKLQPQCDVDFTDHGYPGAHPYVPHRHKLTPNNPTLAPKGGYKRGSGEPL